jgi:hypothetical protein
VLFRSVSLAGARNAYEERRAAAEIRAVVQGILKDGVDADISDVRPRAKGDAGEVERTLKVTFADVVRSARRYNAEIVALGLQDLSARTIARTDKGDLLARIQKARDLTLAYRREMGGKFADLRQRVETSRMSPASKAAFLAGVEAGIGGSQERLDRILDLQIEVLDLNEEQIVFLKSRPRAWVVQNNTFMFYDRADMQAFNARAMRIEAAAAEIARIQAGQRARMQDFEKEMGEYSETR